MTWLPLPTDGPTQPLSITSPDGDEEDGVEQGWPACTLLFSEKSPVTDVCISVITKSELLFGVEVSPRQQQDDAALSAFLGYVEVLNFPDGASRHYAQIRAALKMLGTMIGANDLFIAAHARSLGLTLVTNNPRELRVFLS